MKSSFRDHFLIYEGIRKAFLLGLNIRPILEAVDARPGERILDAGCGFGLFAKQFPECDYTGIDSDPERVRWAVANVGETPKRRFLTGDICRTPFRDGSFDKAVGYGLLHHLSDAEARQCLSELSRVVKGRVVFSDPVYSRSHWINNFLCRHDQGRHVRREDEYDAICGAHFAVRSRKCFYSNNRLARYFLLTASRD